MLSGVRKVLTSLAYGFHKSLFSMAVTWPAGSLTHAVSIKLGGFLNHMTLCQHFKKTNAQWS